VRVADVLALFAGGADEAEILEEGDRILSVCES